MLAFFHGLGKVSSAYKYLFYDFDWGFVRVVDQIGFLFPAFFAICAALAEFLGGIFMAVGFATRVSSAFVLFTMLVAIYRHTFVTGDMNFEKAGLYAVVSLLFLLYGAGKYSIDSLIAKKNDKA